MSRTMMGSLLGLASIVFILVAGAACDRASKRFDSSQRQTKMEFHPALGDPEEIPKSIRPIFASGHFESKKPPGPSDWLARHDEPGQTFDQYRSSDPNRPTSERDTIYLQPLGSFEGANAPSLEKIERFAQAYFQMEVKVRDPVDIEEADITRRENPAEGHLQLLTGDILELLGGRLPDDAFCMVGITMIDLYPDPSWNFVFGQASLRNRVGVFSFARYEADDPKLTLRRSMKVTAHETGHMFGIRHCTYFECMMNGSNHLAEADERPIFLGPVDLRKLMWNVEFDPVERYRELATIYDEVGFMDDRDRARKLAELGE